MFGKTSLTNFLKHARRKRRTIGLALGSGSARGWAHIGIIRALEEAGIAIDCIAGTSIGALVGAVYASENIEKLEESVVALDRKRVAGLVDIVFPRSGLIDGKKINNFIQSHIEERNIEELPIPFRAVSTNLANGHEYIFKDGSIIEAVRASISIPGVFRPVRRDDILLVDGGIVNPVPVNVLRDMGADFIIAVDLNHDDTNGNTLYVNGHHEETGLITENHEPKPIIESKFKLLEKIRRRFDSDDTPHHRFKKQQTEEEHLPGIFEVMAQSISIMEAQLTDKRLADDPPDILLRPQLRHIRFHEFYKGKDAIEEGYKEAKEQIEQAFKKGVL